MYLREIQLLRELDHPGIIKIVDILEKEFKDNKCELDMILEKMDCDLLAWLID